MILYRENPRKSLLKKKQRGHRIKDFQKLIVFVYAGNEQSKNEINKTIPLTIAAKRIKFLGITLTKEE